MGPIEQSGPAQVAYDADWMAGALNAAGRPNRVVVDPLSLHRWIPQAPGEVVNWFRTYNS